MAVPALRKGQYSTDNISAGGLAFKRRYTDATTDSYVLVSISGNATFNNIPNGEYTDAITGDKKTVTNGSLSASVSGKGNMRVYVLSTSKTPAPGKIGTDGKYLYASSPVTVTQGNYDGKEEALAEETGNGGEEPVDPILLQGEQAIFFEKGSDWGSSINTYIYYDSNGVNRITQSWPGDKMTNLGGGVYKYEFTGTINGWKVLFNDGSRQAPASVGWEVVNGGYYKVNGLDHVITPTVINSNKDISLPSIRIYTANRTICIESPENKRIRVTAIDGRIVREMLLTKGINMIIGLERGVYIVEGQKIVLY